jgi:glycosyltransferase involved in cell wall biosynthesis
LKPAVAIWRNDLLPSSETFVAQQAGALESYRPLYVGRKLTNPGVFKLDDVFTLRESSLVRGRLEHGWYTITRRSPTLRSYLRQAGPALIHAHFGIDGVYALPYKRFLGVPLVTTFHGYDATRSTESMRRDWHFGWRLYHRYLSQLRAEGDQFIAVSGYIRDRLVERGFPQERIQVHYIGVDVDQFRFREAVPDGKRRRVLAVGRLVEKKGTADLIRAMAHVVRQLPAAELRIVGDGPLRNELEQLTSDLRLNDHVSFLGTVPQQVVRKELVEADVFALPSVTAKDGNSEGLPISILEAMASGVPVVSTWHSGIPEAVLHERTGLLVPEREPEQLAAALLRILRDPDTAMEMARQGRQVVERSFSLKRQTHELERLYDRMLSAQGGAH